MQTTIDTTNLMTAPTEDVHGFYGTILTDEKLTETKAKAAWECAMRTITEVAGGSAILARNFLRDSRGRHFADATSCYHGTLASRIQQASGERWVTKTLQRLAAAGYADELFEGDPARD
ncbi:hypothetical protein OpiT1DRAFT_04013 [Opitutaceae bacterium TAV1]|nr:hypothetical protein OpiT1DRAFT_04013 [Opitutaceae bacterium TAV1]